MGGGHARQLGATQSVGQWVAYLDDDDEWEINKLKHQLEIEPGKERQAQAQIVSCQVIQRKPGSQTSSQSVPRYVIQDGQSIEDYLFRRRLPSIRRATMYTSTLLVSRDIVERVEWRTQLKRHQDWDWLIRASHEKNVRITQISMPLVTIWVGSHGSISASPDWRSSLSWAKDTSPSWRPSTASDFLAAQPLRYAIHARSVQGIVATVQAIIETRRFPHIRCVAIGLGGLLSRQHLERALLVMRGKK